MIIKTLSGELFAIQYDVSSDRFDTLAKMISEISPEFHPDFMMLTRENGESFHPWMYISNDEVPDLGEDETLMLIITTDVYTMESKIDVDKRRMLCKFKSWIETELDSDFYEFTVKWTEDENLEIVCQKIVEGVDEMCDFPPVQRQNVIDELCEEVRSNWARIRI